MADTGWVVCGTGEDAGGSGASWIFPTAITAEDEQPAAASLTSPLSSRLLRGSNFNLTVPPGATITGVETRIVAYTGSAFSAPNYDRCNIGKDNTTLGTVKNPGDTLTETAVNYEDGGPTDKFGLSLSPSEVNASTFQVLVGFLAPSSPSNALVDAVYVKVHYDEPVGALLPPFYNDADAFFDPTVGRSTTALSAPFLADAEAFFSPTVERIDFDIQPVLFVDADAYFVQTINNGDTQALTPDLFSDDDVFFAPSVGTDADLSPALFVDGETFFAPTVVLVTQHLLAPHHVDSDIFSPASAGMPGPRRALVEVFY